MPNGLGGRTTKSHVRETLLILRPEQATQLSKISIPRMKDDVFSLEEARRSEETLIFFFCLREPLIHNHPSNISRKISSGSDIDDEVDIF